MRAHQLQGQRFARLTVQVRGLNDSHGARWWCHCICGKGVLVPASALVTGNTRSCGCLHHDAMLARNRTHGHAKRGDRHRLYWTWAGMIARCENPKHVSWPYYGARGIRVCDRWRRDFRAFLNDVGPQSSPSHSLDRIDPNGDYAPSNVRWATPHEQRINRAGRCANSNVVAPRRAS